MNRHNNPIQHLFIKIGTSHQKYTITCQCDLSAPNIYAEKQSSSWLYHKYYTNDRYIKRNILNTSDIIAYRSIPAFAYLAEQIANLASLNTKVIHVSTLIQKTAKLLSDWTLSDAD